MIINMQSREVFNKRADTSGFPSRRHCNSPYSTASTTAQRSNRTASTRLHKVKKGETLYSIARKRGTTVAAICKLNHIDKNKKLKQGQILKFN